jgi:hypothetical protein
MGSRSSSIVCSLGSYRQPDFAGDFTIIIGTGMLAGAYPAMTMSAKATAAWIGSFFVLALAIFAWYAWAANGMAYGSVFGLPSQTAAASLFRVRALRFLVLALIAETIGVGTIVWQLTDDQSTPRRALAAIGISVVVSVLTFECLRP